VAAVAAGVRRHDDDEDDDGFDADLSPLPEDSGSRRSSPLHRSGASRSAAASPVVGATLAAPASFRSPRAASTSRTGSQTAFLRAGRGEL